MTSLDPLHQGLTDAWALHQGASTVEHVVVVLPSYTLFGAAREHYASRISGLEHRHLLSLLEMSHSPSCHIIFVSCEEPAPEVLRYVLSLMPETAGDVLSRFEVLVVPGPRNQSLAANLLERPDLLDELRERLRGRPAMLDPWIVTRDEAAVARALGVPVNGPLPALRHLGTKGGGRRLFRQLGVPVPAGREEIRQPGDVVAAIRALRHEQRALRAVVVKLDDSTSGDGNRVLELGDPLALHSRWSDVRRVTEALPPWFRQDLRRGGVVEELVEGATVTSPSVQLDITPCGEVRVLSTHEQVLGGPDLQLYDGCRFPAIPAYSAALAEHGGTVGRALAERGAVGRLSVDFMARQDRDGAWQLYAIEINLRKSGTTYPFSALQHLVPGCYDPGEGRYVTADGSCRAYSSSDTLLDQGWVGLSPTEVVGALRDAGVAFDPATGSGALAHTLSGLRGEGRLGLTAIGLTPDHAAALYGDAVTALRRLARPAAAAASPAGP